MARRSKLCCVAAISSAIFLVLSNSNTFVGVEASHNNYDKKNNYHDDDYYGAYDYFDDDKNDDDDKHQYDHVAYHYYTAPVEIPTTTVETTAPPVETAYLTTVMDVTYTQTQTIKLTVPEVAVGPPANITDHRLYKALDQCTWDGADNITQTVRYFNAIVFGDYNAQNSQEIYGPLGVDGNLVGTDFNLYTHYPSDVCSDLNTNSLHSYGLVVHGAVDITNTALVHGAGFLDGGGDTDHVNVVEPGCPLNEGTTGRFDFDAVHNAYLVASEELASFPPNMVLDSSDQLTIDESNSVAAGTQNYYVMALNTCTVFDGSCTDLWPGQVSYPDHILLGNGNWNGLANGRVFPTDKTIVLNIPVDDGATIYVRTRRPHAGGFNACRTIFNFYPVDSNGNYEPNGWFTLHRENDGELQGMILAPLGHIEDAPTGRFAGQVIGLDYYWQAGNSRVIRDFSATGCDINYTGCLPLIANEVEETCTTTTTLVTSTIDTATATETEISTDTVTSETTTTTTELSTETDTSITTTTETQGSIGTITVLTNTDTTTTTNFVVSTETDVITTTDVTTVTEVSTGGLDTQGGGTTITETDERTTTLTITVDETSGAEENDNNSQVTLITVQTITTTATGAPITTIHDLSTATIIEQHTVTENGRETVYIPVEVPNWESDSGNKNHGGGGGHYYGKEKDHWNKKDGWKKHENDKGSYHDGKKKWSYKKDHY